PRRDRDRRDRFVGGGPGGVAGCRVAGVGSGRGERERVRPRAAVILFAGPCRGPPDTGGAAGVRLRWFRSIPPRRATLGRHRPAASPNQGTRPMRPVMVLSAFVCAAVALA